MTQYSKYTLHPWHGVEPGKSAPQLVNAFIEIVPTDTVKYEVDKASGWLKVDRPQQFSNIVPALYGFIPQTLCDIQTGEYCMSKTGRTGIIGDQDPIDVVVLSEKTFPTSGFLMQVVPIGGFRMIDKNEADDKIIAVMKDDAVYGHYTDITQIEPNIIKRLQHYFLTYKDMPGTTGKTVEIADVYGAAEAREVIVCSLNDYRNRFSNEQ